ncbi:acyl transferase [Nocardia sp. NBC_00511]|uniref:acyl transferase n=1 Tax=Nocardia sp. NBC_00511 TaxID=2903591 RepID=UPI0030E457C8
MAPPVIQSPVPPIIQSPVPPVSPPTTSPATGYPPSGTTFSGENMTAGQITDLQQAVDNGHQPWRLDRVSVAKSFLQGRFGWTDVQTEFGPPTVLFVTNKDGGKLSVHLVQPATQGDNGIWEVASGTWN